MRVDENIQKKQRFGNDASESVSVKDEAMWLLRSDPRSGEAKLAILLGKW